MKGNLLETIDSIVGIAKCQDGGWGIVVKLEPTNSAKSELKAYGIEDGAQYKLIHIKDWTEVPLTKENNKFSDSNKNDWEIVDL